MGDDGIYPIRNSILCTKRQKQFFFSPRLRIAVRAEGEGVLFAGDDHCSHTRARRALALGVHHIFCRQCTIFALFVPVRRDRIRLCFLTRCGRAFSFDREIDRNELLIYLKKCSTTNFVIRILWTLEVQRGTSLWHPNVTRIKFCMLPCIHLNNIEVRSIISSYN